MPNLNRQVRSLVDELTPDPERIGQARDRVDRLVSGLDRISDRFTVKRIRPHGSIERGTAIRGFDDIDQLVVLDRNDLRTRAGRRPTPSYTIKALADEIERLRAGLVAMGTLQVRRQSHSVGVEYPRSGLQIDLVPALPTRGPGVDIYEIPSRSAGSWIKTNVRTLEERASRAPKKLIDSIRLIKGWRRARGRNKGFSLPSYAMELMLLNGETPAHNTPPLDIVRMFFERIARADKRRRLVLDDRVSSDPVSFHEPWTGENLMSKNTARQRVTLIEKCRWTVEKLDEAAEAPTDKGARALLRQLFVGTG